MDVWNARLYGMRQYSICPHYPCHRTRSNESRAEWGPIDAFED